LHNIAGQSEAYVGSLAQEPAGIQWRVRRLLEVEAGRTESFGVRAGEAEIGEAAVRDAERVGPRSGDGRQDRSVRRGAGRRRPAGGVASRCGGRRREVLSAVPKAHPKFGDRSAFALLPAVSFQPDLLEWCDWLRTPDARREGLSN
jgi:hypothetical protein